MYLLLVTIIPSIIILLFFMYSDRFREPRKSILKVFIYGCLICIPAYFANTILDSFWFYQTKVPEELIGSFLAPAFVEEALKFSVLYYVVYKMKDFNEPIDGIVYGVTVSLGFATLENIYYVFLVGYEDPLAVAYLRAFSAIPGHALDGVFMGYFFMRYVYIQKRNNLMLTFLVPYFLHAYYNYFAVINYKLMYLELIIGWAIALILFKNLKADQKLKREEYEKKL